MIPPYKGFNVELIAMLCHETNRAYCESRDDFSNRQWEYAPEELRASTISGVKAHIDKDLKPGESHNLWMLARIKTGWTYGAVKDEYLKTHPNLVAYSELPAGERVKDFLFTGIVRAFKEFAAAEEAEAAAHVAAENSNGTD